MLGRLDLYFQYMLQKNFPCVFVYVCVLQCNFLNVVKFINIFFIAFVFLINIIKAFPWVIKELTYIFFCSWMVPFLYLKQINLEF